MELSDIKTLISEAESTLETATAQDGSKLYSTERWLCSAAVMNLAGAIIEDKETDYALNLCAACLDWSNPKFLYDAIDEAVNRIRSGSDGGPLNAELSTLEDHFLSPKARQRKELRALERNAVAATIDPVDVAKRVRAALGGIDSQTSNANGLAWLVGKLQGYCTTLHDALIRDVTRSFQREMKLASIGLLDNDTLEENYSKAVNAVRDGIQRVLPALIELEDRFNDEIAQQRELDETKRTHDMGIDSV